MDRRLTLLFLPLFCGHVVCAHGPPPTHSSSPEASQPQTATSKRVDIQSTHEDAARAFVERLFTRAFGDAASRFEPEMKAEVKVSDVQQAWDGFVGKVGAPKEVGQAHVTPVAQGFVVDVECVFSSENANIRVAFNKSQEVVGFFFRPGWNPPDYADPKAFVERALTVGAPPYVLPAVLTVPRERKGALPAVILVHGSGPNDADESYGPQKPFKDLAWGLASRGIAVLRFNKRTEEYRWRLPNDAVSTVKEEVLDDVRTAVDALHHAPEIDSHRIALIGHSLGAMLLPRIARDDPRVHALVLLAGPTRPDGQIIFAQTKHLAEHSSWPPDVRAREVDKAKSMAARLDAADLGSDEKVDGIEGRYWIDLREHHGAKIVGGLSIPILVLQGGRDYQVTLEDFQGWQRALSNKPNATLRAYDHLDHHFVRGEGSSTPADYERPGHVDKEVIDDIAQWLQAH